MRRGADGGLQSTSATNKMRDTPAARGRLGCFCLLAQLVLWYFCRTSAYSHVRCLRTISASQVISDSLRSGSWKAIHGKANRTRWQLCIPRVPANRNTHPTGRGLSCMPGCLQCSSCLDRLKLQPLAKQMFSSAMLSELQLNRTTAASHQASTSTLVPEWQVAFPASAQLHWSYTPGLQVANMWIWRPWTEGLGCWEQYTSSCTGLQAMPVMGWKNNSGGCASPVCFCRHCFFCDAALLSHARLNVASIFDRAAWSCTQLKPCVKLNSLQAHGWLIFHLDTRVLYWCLVRSAKSHSSIRLRLLLNPGDADQCAFLPRLEESSPGAYLPASVPVTVAESCHPVPRLEVSSPGARFSAELVACCHWLPTPCCRLEVSSPVTQRLASFSGIASDAVVCRSWCLPPGRELNHSCFPSWSHADTRVQITFHSSTFADLLPRESAAQWVCMNSSISESYQLRLLACSCLDSLLLMQPGLVSVPFNSSLGWTSELFHTSLLEPCRKGLWRPARLGLPRGRACFRRLWPAPSTKRPPLSRRKIPWENLDPLSRLLWLRRVCHRPRRRQCLSAATTAPWKLLRRRLLQSRLQLQWGRRPHMAPLRSGPPAPSPATPANDFLSPPGASEGVHIFVPGPRASSQSSFSWRYTITVQVDPMPPKHLQGSKRHRHSTAIHWHSMLGWTQLAGYDCVTPVGCSEKDALPHASAHSWLTWVCSSHPAPHCSLPTRLGSPVADASLAGILVCLSSGFRYHSPMLTDLKSSMPCSVLVR